MEPLDQAAQLITSAKNVCIVARQPSDPESALNALALFYTLRELQKNVNLVMDRLEDRLQPFAPSLEHLSVPSDVVISIPRGIADVSQIYYEKTDEQLKIHLTASGPINKEHLSFYRSQPKPDLVIALGIADFHHELQTRLNEYGFLLGAPILDIDAHAENTRFGQINLTDGNSITETTAPLAALLAHERLSNQTANCLLAALVARYGNFAAESGNPEILELAAELIRQGADSRLVNRHLSQSSPAQIQFLSAILSSLNFSQPVAVAALDDRAFYEFGETEAAQAVEKLRGLGIGKDVLVLWQGHASDPAVRGFFLPANSRLMEKMSGRQEIQPRQTWALLQIPGTDMEATKQSVLEQLSL